MEYLIGLILAGAVAAFAVIVGFDRERSFYSTVMIIIASYYVLFAVQGASAGTLIMELIAGSVFLGAAVLGFKKSLWFVAAGSIGHGIFDFVHHWMIQNPGVPPWWPGFCLGFDVAFGAFIAWRLMPHSRSALNRTVAPERGSSARP